MQNKEFLLVFIGIGISIIYSSCSSSYKYSYNEDNYPCFTGDFRQAKLVLGNEQSKLIKVVSFNIEFAQNIEGAMKLLSSDSLRDVDVFLLQEMDEKGSRMLAEKLEMAFVYYPLIYHPRHKKNVGNTILSSWPIVKSRKIRSPFSSNFPVLKDGKNYKFRKGATVAHVMIDTTEIVFATTHAPAINTTPTKRQFAKALVDSLENINNAYKIVSGDFNTLGSTEALLTFEAFEKDGYLWATQNVGSTVSTVRPILKSLPKTAFQLDHIFVKGLCILSAYTIYQQGVSDHLPVLVELQMCDL